MVQFCNLSSTRSTLLFRVALLPSSSEHRTLTSNDILCTSFVCVCGDRCSQISDWIHNMYQLRSCSLCLRTSFDSRKVDDDDDAVYAFCVVVVVVIVTTALWVAWIVFFYANVCLRRRAPTRVHRVETTHTHDAMTCSMILLSMRRQRCTTTSGDEIQTITRIVENKTTWYMSHLLTCVMPILRNADIMRCVIQMCKRA